LAHLHNTEHLWDMCACVKNLHNTIQVSKLMWMTLWWVKNVSETYCIHKLIFVGPTMTACQAQA